MADRVRIRKEGTRDGRPVMLEDGRVVEGDELSPAAPGLVYQVRRTVMEEEGAPEIFRTSPVRAVIRDAQGRTTLITDNSRYAVEVVGR